MQFTITRRNILARDSALRAVLHPAAAEVSRTLSPFQSFSLSSDFLNHWRAIRIIGPRWLRSGAETNKVKIVKLSTTSSCSIWLIKVLLGSTCAIPRYIFRHGAASGRVGCSRFPSVTGLPCAACLAFVITIIVQYQTQLDTQASCGALLGFICN